MRFFSIAERSFQEVRKEFLYLFSSNKPKKILFDHLPKCGGSSLNLYLESHYPRRKIFSTDGQDPRSSVERFKNFSQSKRYGYDLIIGHFTNQLSDYVHPECLKITMLREPVDRIVSHYYYAKRTPAHYLYSKIHKSNMSLEDYVTSGLSSELQNWYTTHFSNLSLHDIEQNPNSCVNIAFKALKKYDIVGFLHDYSSFTNRLQDQAELRYRYKNKKVNVSQERVDVYDIQNSTIQLIKQVNHLDILLYKKILQSN